MLPERINVMLDSAVYWGGSSIDNSSILLYNFTVSN